VIFAIEPDANLRAFNFMRYRLNCPLRPFSSLGEVAVKPRLSERWLTTANGYLAEGEELGSNILRPS
jgi:hypothetical protein